MGQLGSARLGSTALPEVGGLEEVEGSAGLEGRDGREPGVRRAGTSRLPGPADTESWHLAVEQ